MLQVCTGPPMRLRNDAAWRLPMQLFHPHPLRPDSYSCQRIAAFRGRKQSSRQTMIWGTSMLTIIPRKFAGLIAAAFLLPSIGAVQAASPEPGDPVYHTPRYNDDFSYLADTSKRTDAWD